MGKPQTALYARSRWSLIGLAIVGAALFLVAAACSGDDSNANDNTGADASATPAGGTPGASQLSDDVSKALTDLGAEWAKTTAKASYDIATNDQGTATETLMNLYWAPPKVRVDMLDVGGGGSSPTIIISTPDNTYSCSQENGEQCLAYPGTSNPSDILPFLSGFDAAAIQDGLNGLTGTFTVVPSDEEVAGDSASCISISGTIDGQDGSGKWCFASNGLLLFQSQSTSDTTGQPSTFTLQAMDIGTPSDSDFDPPYPVTEAPTETPAPAPTATPGG